MEKLNTKWCPRCEAHIDISLFYLNKGRSDGLSPLCREHAREAEAVSREKRRKELLALFNSQCKICGYSNFKALEIDHINGGGGQQRKNMPAHGKKWYEYVRDNIIHFQCLCANCHSIKKYDSDETVGVRQYDLQIPTEKKQGIGRGNSDGSQKAASNWWATATPEQIAETQW